MKKKIKEEISVHFIKLFTNTASKTYVHIFKFLPKTTILRTKYEDGVKTITAESLNFINYQKIILKYILIIKTCFVCLLKNKVENTF